MIYVKSVPVFVEDQVRALAFYCEKLDFRVVMDFQMSEDFRWLVIAPPDLGTEIILYCPAQSVNGDAEAEIRQRIGQWTGIILRTDDIKATHELLVERGVEFKWGPRLQPWRVWEAMFSDPDGNEFHLVQRPEQIPSDLYARQTNVVMAA